MDYLTNVKLSPLNAMSAQKRLILIEYPGVVKNVDKMLETLGGMANLKKVFSNSSLRLQLKFRPNDPFAHCAIADKLQTNSLWVRTSKKRLTYADGSTEIKYETSIVGVIEATYRFQTLADFQWLPLERTHFDAKATLDKIVTFEKSPTLNFDVNNIEMREESDPQNDPQQDDQVDDQADNELRKRSQQLLEKSSTQPATYRSIFKQVYPHDPLDGKVRKLDADAPLFIMPMIFSRFDSPSDYYYKSDPKPKKKRSKEEEEQPPKNNPSTISFNRKSRSKYVYLVTFQEDPPSERIEPQTDANMDQQLLAKLKENFEERPIWSKTELAYRHQLRRIDLKFYLPLVAYYYVNGPFRGQWVRFGFNPKEDPSSRFYQTLDLRTQGLLRQKTRTNDPDNMGRSSSTQVVFNQIKSYATLEKKMREIQIVPDQSDTDRLTDGEESTVSALNKTLNSSSRKTYAEKVTDVASFKFLTGRLPKYKQIFYELINIELDEVQQLIDKEPFKELCDEKDGWWPVGTLDKVRSLCIGHVESLFDAEDDTNSVLVDNLNEMDEELMEYSYD